MHRLGIIVAKTDFDFHLFIRRFSP